MFRAVRVRFALQKTLLGFMRQCFIAIPEVILLLLDKFFEIEKSIVCALGGSDQFVQLDLHGLCISVLRVLNQKNHQKVTIVVAVLIASCQVSLY